MLLLILGVDGKILQGMMMLRSTFLYWYLYYFLVWCYRLVSCPPFLQLHKLCFPTELAICQCLFFLKSFAKYPVSNYYVISMNFFVRLISVLLSWFVCLLLCNLYGFIYLIFPVWYELIIGFLFRFTIINCKHWINS